MSAALRSLYQDMLGKEQYLKLIDAGWVSAGITVPIALAMCIWAILLMSNDKKDVKHREESENRISGS
jgi:hypothetical protein